MRSTILIITTVVLFGIMSGLLPTLSIAGVVPNLILLFILCLAIENRNDFLLVAFVGGLLADLATGAGVGTFTVGYLLVGTALHYIINQFFFLQSGWKYLPIAAVAGIIVLGIWTWLYTLVLVRFHVLPISFFSSPLPRATVAEVIYGLVALYPIYNGTRVLLNWLRRLEQKQRFG